MDGDRRASALGRRDVIGAWLVCLLVAAACLGPAASKRLDRSAASVHSRAAATGDRQPTGRC